MRNILFVRNNIKIIIYFILISKLFSNAAFSEPVSLEDIKSMLNEQNKILTQQKETIENLRIQNKGLERVIETYHFDNSESIQYDDEVNIYTDSNEDDKWAYSLSYRTGYRIGSWGSPIQGSASEGSITTVNFEELGGWFNGGSISIRSPWLPKTSLILSGSYSRSSARATFIATKEFSPEFDTAITADGTLKTDVIDVEALLRTSIEDTNLNWSVGLQYYQLDNTTTLFSDLVFFPPSLQEQSFKTEYFLPKVGIGGYMELAENHRIFSNLLFTIGYGKVSGDVKEDLFIVGGDINFGYQWIINKNFSISPRYRFQAIYVDSKENLVYRDQFFILHGPELNLTYHF